MNCLQMKKTFEIVCRDGKYYVVDCDDGRVIYTYGHTLKAAEKKLRQLTIEASVYGWGCNDADYVITSKVDGKRVVCLFYRTWYDMLKRCHSPAYQENRPTYKGCKVCEEWRYFSTFRAWMETQDWEGKELDKDIIGNGKLYSSEMCRFVDKALNTLMTDCRNARSPYPVGVSEYGKGYRADCRRGKRQYYLGYFKTVKEAFHVYVKVKTEYVMEVARNYDKEIQAGLGRFCDRLWNEYYDYALPS